MVPCQLMDVSYISMFNLCMHGSHACTYCYRKQLAEEYKKQTSSVLAHWEEELEKTKAEEEKLQALLQQQQKLFQQQRAAQTQSLKTIKKLHQQYMKVYSMCDYRESLHGGVELH